MIKLLHLADLHLGKTFRMLGQRGSAQRRTLQSAFERAVGLAIDRQVQACLIAGDLFDTAKPSDSTVEFVAKQLRRLDDAGIITVLLAGNHDVGEDGYVGPSASLRRSGSRLYLIGAEAEAHVFPELELTIVARSATPGTPVSPLSGWPRTRTTHYAVGVVHGATYRAGQVEGAHVIHPKEIRELELDYLALGDWHTAFQVLPPPTVAWYAGAPEWLSFDQTDPGAVLLVEIAAPKSAQVTPVVVGQRRFTRLEANAAEVDEGALRAMIAEVADPELVCEVVLSGLLPLQRLVDTGAIEHDLAERFFRLRIVNRTRVWMDEESLDGIPVQTVLGQFVKLLAHPGPRLGPGICPGDALCAIGSAGEGAQFF